MTTNSVRLLGRKQLQVFVWFSIWRGIAAEKYQLTNAMKPPWYSSMFRCFPHRIYLSLESSLSRWKMWSCRLPLPASPVAPRISAFTSYFTNLSYFGDLESQKNELYMFFSKSAFNQRAVKSLQWSSHRSRFGTVWNMFQERDSSSEPLTGSLAGLDLLSWNDDEFQRCRQCRRKVVGVGYTYWQIDV